MFFKKYFLKLSTQLKSWCFNTLFRVEQMNVSTNKHNYVFSKDKLIMRNTLFFRTVGTILEMLRHFLPHEETVFVVRFTLFTSLNMTR